MIANSMAPVRLVSRFEAEWLKRSFAVAGVFCLLAAFYFATGVSNRAEAMDSLFFAADAEVSSFWTNHDGRMLLFYWLNRATVRASAGLGLDVNVYTLLGLLGSIFAAASVILFYKILRNGFRLAVAPSIAGAATLGLSYGFMRYANEAEVYVGAIFMILVCLTFLFRWFSKPVQTISQATRLGLVGGVAVSYYQPVAIPLFLAAAVLFIARRSFLQYLIYCAAGMASYFSILTLALWGELSRMPSIVDVAALVMQRSEEFSPPPLGLATIFKAAAAVFADFLSTTPLYAVGLFERVLKAHIVNYFQIEDLLFTAKNYPFNGLAIVTFCLALAWFVYLIAAVLRQRQWPALDGAIVFVFGWLSLMAVVNIMLNPGEREVWIVGLVPLTILISVFIYAPLASKPWRLGIMVALLGGHNLIGGLWMFRNEAADLYATKTAWLRQNAVRGDWLLTTLETNDWYHRKRIIRYPFSGGVQVDARNPFLNFMHFDGVEATHQRWPLFPDARLTGTKIFHVMKEAGGRVFVLEAALTPKPLPAHYGANHREGLDDFASFLKPYAKVVADGPGGKTYQIDMEQLPAGFPPQ